MINPTINFDIIYENYNIIGQLIIDDSLTSMQLHCLYLEP